MNGEKIDQTMVVEKIMRSMPQRFNDVVFSIEESRDVTIMSIEALHSSLLVHEQMMNGNKEEDQVLKVTNVSKPSRRGRGHGSTR